MKTKSLIAATLAAAALSISVMPSASFAQDSAAASSTAKQVKPTAIMLRASALRSRPTAAGTGDVIVPAETRVRVESKLSNADGDWWFVTATGLGGGWILQSEAGDPQN